MGKKAVGAYRKQLTPTQFWALANRAESGCWEWTRGRNRAKAGYGRVMIRGRIVLTHRYAWQLVFGAIPNGMRVLHRCDNPLCIHPGHLFLGTQLDNIADCYRKGRTYRGPKPMPDRWYASRGLTR